MNLVSIIVPMYNEESNVQNCIETLKTQTNQRFDAVFIDDGSTDNTVSSLKRLLSSGVKFNYRIVEQRNKGAAAARKEGINHTLTEFIMILDCDDKLSTDLVEEIYEKNNEYSNVDIIIPNMRVQNKNGEWSDFIFYTKDLQLKPLDCINNSLNGWYIHGCFGVRRSVIHRSYKDYEIYNKDNENYINNDEVITRLNFKNSKKIVRSNSEYYYCYNMLSTTRKINNKKYLMIKNALIMNNIFLDNEKLQVRVREDLIAVLWGVSIYMNKHRENLENIQEWKKLIKETAREINYFTLFNQLSFKKKIQLTILKLVN